MRFLVSTFCLTLVGFSPVLGAAQEIYDLQLDSANAANEYGSVFERPTAQRPLPVAPVARPSTGFNDVFDDALSQFSGQRVANRVANRTTIQQDPQIIVEETRAELQAPGRLEAMSPESPALDPENSVAASLTDTALPKDPVMRTESAFPSTPHESIFSGVGQLGPGAGEAPRAWKIPRTEKKTNLASTKKSLPGWSDFGDRSATDQNKTPAASSNGWSQPAETLTWWKVLVNQPIDGTRMAEAVDSNSLVYRALQNSPRIQAISQTPLIRELQIVEADSEFDAVQYVRSQFEDRVDPVGNELTVGNGESFLKDNIWTADAGFRKKARNGAQWELNQRLGFQNSNSNFFVPQDQGTATLALNVTQPLLRGRGKYFNESQILIAQATNGVAWQSFQSELQDELLGVMSGYWDLYLTRSIYLQKLRNVERGQKILDRLEGRKELDSLPSQIARARSSVQTRRTELANTARDVLNAETEIRRRIADTSWMGGGGGSELIPAELPMATTFEIPLEQVVYSAIEHRPEIHEAMNQVRIASIQRDVSANELLPELSLLLGTYVSALRADTGILNAFQDQFGQVKPGYSFGINFEIPYGNRAARSRLAQREIQARMIKAQFDEVMQNIIAESQVALRRVASAAETRFAAEEAIRAARIDTEQFERRWESFALVEGDLAEGQSPTTVLDQLLDAQDRLASAETVYVQSERELKVAEVALQHTMGTLLMTQNVSAARGFEGDTPRIDVFKSGTSAPAMAFESPVYTTPIR